MRLTKRSALTAAVLTAAVALPAGAAVTGPLASVHRPAPSVSLSTRTPGVVLEPGRSTAVRVSVARTAVAGPVRLAVTGLPPSSSARFDPPRLVDGHATTLTVRTGARTPEGRYRLTVTATAGGVTGRLGLSLVVERPGVPFSVTGTAWAPLSPGTAVPVATSVHNPNRSALRVTDLEVTVVSTSSPGCSAATNYRTRGYRGRTLTVPARGTRTLHDLGAPVGAWPQVTMLDLPVNQDACKGARLTLRLTGRADGGERA